jgi:hypothetical protein
MLSVSISFLHFNLISEITGAVGNKLLGTVTWMILNLFYDFCFITWPERSLCDTKKSLCVLFFFGDWNSKMGDIVLT